MVIVKPEALRKVCDSLTLQRCAQLAAIMNQKIAEYGITSWDEFHEFVGQVVHESGQFSLKVENMNYSAKRMAEVWPNRFSKTKNKPYIPNDMAIKLARKPVELANYSYGGRMGNVKPNDGWDFRGRGYIGITGRAMYELYGKYKKMTPETVAKFMETEEGAMDCAFWFFYVYRNLKQLAIDDNDKQITIRINGGLINYGDRIKYTERAEKYLN